MGRYKHRHKRKKGKKKYWRGYCQHNQEYQFSSRIVYHHLRPRSRFGCDEKWNKYPLNIEVHTAFHDLFGNSTLREIWEVKLEEIYKEVYFCSIDNYLKNCSNEEQNRVLKLYLRKKANWLKAFGSEEIEDAKKILKKMMWWHIFLDLKPEKVTEEILRKKIKEIVNNKDRRWAFEKLFDCKINNLPSDILGNIIKYNI